MDRRILVVIPVVKCPDLSDLRLSGNATPGTKRGFNLSIDYRWFRDFHGESAEIQAWLQSDLWGMCCADLCL
jgi:hypothetical protein